jgi:DNA-binding NarL/FixJ family response regulator
MIVERSTAHRSAASLMVVSPRSSCSQISYFCSGLADRELAVAKLIAQGKTNHEISRELFISVATVKAYVSRLLSKLELNNRVQVALLVHDAALD